MKFQKRAFFVFSILIIFLYSSVVSAVSFSRSLSESGEPGWMYVNDRVTNVKCKIPDLPISSRNITFKVTDSLGRHIPPISKGLNFIVIPHGASLQIVVRGATESELDVLEGIELEVIEEREIVEEEDYSTIVSITQQDSEGNTPFHLAARIGNIDKLRLLVERAEELSRYGFPYGSNISRFTKQQITSKNSEGYTLLHLAALGGHDEVIKFLIDDCNCDVDIQAAAGATPLALASREGHETTVNLLLDMHARFLPERIGFSDTYDRNTPAHYAAYNGHLTILRIFAESLSPELWINRENRRRLTPVCYAAQQGHADVVQYLVEIGAHINLRELYRDHRRKTPLMLAAKNGHIEIVELLLRRGANLDDIDIKGNTALHYACKKKQVKVISLLLNAGANRYVRNKQNMFPLDLIMDIGVVNEVQGDRITREINVTDSDHSPYDCALCSSIAYDKSKKQLQEWQDGIDIDIDSNISWYNVFAWLKAGCKKYKKESCTEKFQKYCKKEKQLKDRGWGALQTSEDVSVPIGLCDGYFGVAYYRIDDSGATVVVAHRGTDIYKDGNLVAGLEIIKKEKPSIICSALLYVKNIFNGVFNINGNPVIRIIHTGHSLGGFIAAVCSLRSAFPNTQAITFDAPGCDYLFAHGGRFDERRVINYVTTPNLVNTCNRHVGEIRRLAFYPEQSERRQRKFVNETTIPCYLDMVSTSEIFDTVTSHNLDRLVKNLGTSRVLRYDEVVKWPAASITPVYGSRVSSKDILDSTPYIPFENIVGKIVSNVASGALVVGRQVVAERIWRLSSRVDEKDVQEGIIAFRYQRGSDIRYLTGEDSTALPGTIHSESWYAPEEIVQHLQNMLQRSAEIEIVASVRQFVKVLNDIKWREGCFVISLNVNALNGSFVELNHWVGLVIDRETVDAVWRIRYIDPLGNPISMEIERLIRENLFLTPNSRTEIAHIFNEENHPQVATQVTQEGTTYLEGNTDDCGPFLVAAIYNLFAKSKMPLEARTETESREFGKRIRCILDKRQTDVERKITQLLDKFKRLVDNEIKQENPYCKKIQELYKKAKNTRIIDEIADLLNDAKKIARDWHLRKKRDSEPSDSHKDRDQDQDPGDRSGHRRVRRRGADSREHRRTQGKGSVQKGKTTSHRSGESVKKRTSELKVDSVLPPIIFTGSLQSGVSGFESILKKSLIDESIISSVKIEGIEKLRAF